MIENLRITVLAENTVRAPNLLAEHGLAFWIEAGGHRILFDTGQGRVLCQNARQLDIPLHAAEIIVVSHGHFDHTGGLKSVLESRAHTKLYLHPASLEEKYGRRKTPPHREIGAPYVDVQTLRRQGCVLTWTVTPTELVRGVHVTGEIPRRNASEDVGGPFYLDRACTKPDPLLDDQALYMETSAGLVVVLGCAHAGVVNTLDYITDLTDRHQVYAVLGGMHLVRASKERLEVTVEALRRYGVQKIGTAHCTGMRAVTYLWSHLPEQCFECCVGSVFAVEDGTGKTY
jgi:7,8-dihydropterin-6-yl-methyl-4-(beta-D-ribofuranosyl)aminobenzene 5'-phosphate synthase